jgi:hypothetical protein
MSKTLLLIPTGAACYNAASSTSRTYKHVLFLRSFSGMRSGSCKISLGLVYIILLLILRAQCLIPPFFSFWQNYVVQFVLENGQEQDRLGVIAQLRGRMLQMSRHKFASNVCEKALVTANPDSRRQMIEEMMRMRQDGSSPVVSMMKDQYASTSALPK